MHWPKFHFICFKRPAVAEFSMSLAPSKAKCISIIWPIQVGIETSAVPPSSLISNGTICSTGSIVFVVHCGEELVSLKVQLISYKMYNERHE